MTDIPLIILDPEGLDIVTNTADLRRDIHTFVAYASTRSIKRSSRTNELPRADAKKLLQLLHPPTLNAETLRAYDDYYFQYAQVAEGWIYYVDSIARGLGFVDYAIDGKYASYSSQSPSYQENYITWDAAIYKKFLTLPVTEQERALREMLINAYDYSRNEFFAKDMLSRLKRFPAFGSAVGVMPTLNFAEARRFLLGLLKTCTPGIWYSTASLVKYLKMHHRFFLIPEKIKADRFGRLPDKRYSNFYEEEFTRVPIPDDAPDGFERVEGRYVERFLEAIPLMLGYVDVAYVRPPFTSKFPVGALKAFRVTDRLYHALRDNFPEPKVTVQPNFEIYIESLLYPAAPMYHLTPLTDVVREDTTTTILRLQKQKVAAALANNPDLHVIQLLKSLSSKPLPQNIVVEMEEWSTHADAFTLYEGFDLIEFTGNPPNVGRIRIESVGDRFQLTPHSADVFSRLRETGQIAVRAEHFDETFRLLPETAQSIFPRQQPASAPKKRAEKPAFTIRRESRIVLHFPDDTLLTAFQKALVEAGCPVEASRESHTLTIAGQHERLISQVVKRLRGDYSLQVEDQE